MEIDEVIEGKKLRQDAILDSDIISP